MKEEYLRQLATSWSNCQACPRLVEERSNVVFGMGSPDADVMIIGEAPGVTEDEQGLPFVGKTGNLLDIFLAQISARQEVIDIYSEIVNVKGATPASEATRQHLRKDLRSWLGVDYFFTNTIMCHPPENADPIPTEIGNCSTRLKETIYTVDPLLIIACGKIAAESLLKKKVNISSVRGELFDCIMEGRVGPITYPVMPIYHPSYLMRKNDFNSDEGDAARTVRDLLKAMHICDDLRLRHYGTPKPPLRPKLGA